jgi:hypothetical protein
MALGTRGVLAAAAGALLVVGVAATALGRGRAGVRAVAVGFLLATLWALLGLLSAQSTPDADPRTHLVLLSTAATATVYYGHKALRGVGLTERL